MSTLEMPAAGTTSARRRTGILRDPAGRATAIAGGLLLAGLALAVTDRGGSEMQLAVTGAGAVIALFVLGPIAGRSARRHPGLLGGAVLASVAMLVLLAVVVAGAGAYGLANLVFGVFALGLRLLPFLLALAAGVVGLVLISDDLRGRLGLPARTRSSWQRLSGPSRATPPGSPPHPWRAFAGLGLIGLAAVMALGVAGIYFGAAGLAGLFVLVGVGAVALALLATPVLIAGLARADRGRVSAAREDERQRMAAHLHDSVLQTLAMVQRQAHDPAAVARLARLQEHELRAWMAGESELGSETLGAAILEAVAEVERDHGAVVEVTVLGDRALDGPARALAAGAREALRNAARHAEGASVYVFAQASSDRAEVFVRDEGPGFDLGSVPTERRGVRDAIVGRMASVGGQATVDSRPGEGTEITLRIGRA
jgi:signal transduction histidine kinase